MYLQMYLYTYYVLLPIFTRSYLFYILRKSEKHTRTTFTTFYISFYYIRVST